MIERVIMDIQIPICPVFVAHRVGLEELSPLTRPDQGPGIFPGRHPGLLRIFPVAIHAKAKNRLEAVFLEFSKTFTGTIAQVRAHVKGRL